MFLTLPNWFTSFKVCIVRKDCPEPGWETSVSKLTYSYTRQQKIVTEILISVSHLCVFCKDSMDSLSIWSFPPPPPPPHDNPPPPPPHPPASPEDVPHWIEICFFVSDEFYLLIGLSIWLTMHLAFARLLWKQTKNKNYENSFWRKKK